MDHDRELLRRLQDGDLNAFDALFEAHRRPLLAYVIQLVWDRSQAEDIVQETFISLVENRQRLQPQAGVRGWLFRVARNRAIDSLRRRGRRGAGISEAEIQLADHRDSPADSLARREDHEEIRRLLTRLPDKDREVLHLRFYGGLTFQEISDVLEQPLGTVLWRARKSLKELRGYWSRETNLE